jgi:Holliday junction resolvase RusA-like endonuclease
MLDLVEWPPPGAELVVEMVVLGEPKPAGSKTSGVAYRRGPDGKPEPVRKNGKIVTFTKDSSGAPGKAWRQEVAEAVAQEMFDATLDLLAKGVPLVFEATFVRPRASGHYGSGRNAEKLRDGAPAWPTTRPDGLKLARGVEDAITSVLWHDDSQIVDGRQRKVFGSPERAEFRVWRLPVTVGDLRASANGFRAEDDEEHVQDALIF